ncbi:MAG TPA: alanine racemase [Candidatus Paceibacterota bacterium]|nr:alanine racemase [Verrucomicrobiota bacterium]HRY49046.1 alanine racemase [Candidatus Paceibacterota bacterium]
MNPEMPVSYRCWAEVDLNALRENLAWLRDRVGPQTKIMTVVKADAYGHGLKQIAALLMQSGTDIFGVANLAEAQSIRSIGRGWPILMLGACLPHEVDTLVRDNVMPTLSSLDEAKLLSAAAEKWRRTVDVHIKIDTGMGRLGVQPDQSLSLIEQVQQLPHLRLQGLYTHFCVVEDDASFSQHQSDLFCGVVREVRKRNLPIPWIHACNSGALLHESSSLFNVVRPGLLVYGIVPSGKRISTSTLRKSVHPALSWKCRISLVKNIAPGTSISYGRIFVADRPLKVATLTAGYGDGYLRAASQKAEVLIRGRRCRILGRITMDQMIADITRVPEAQPGDEVILIGHQGKAQITASELAEWMGTIPWEVFTCITARVPRIYHGSHAA